MTDGTRAEHSRSVRWAVVRFAWLGIALTTICVGLAIHGIAFGLAATLRDVAGDALWAVMIYAWMGSLWPLGPLRARAGLALAICWTVEVSQAWHTPWLDAVRRTTAGQLVLGSGFDVRDLGSYAVGVAVGCAAELVARKLFSRQSPN